MSEYVTFGNISISAISSTCCLCFSALLQICCWLSRNYCCSCFCSNSLNCSSSALTCKLQLLWLWSCLPSLGTNPSSIVSYHLTLDHHAQDAFRKTSWVIGVKIGRFSDLNFSSFLLGHLVQEGCEWTSNLIISLTSLQVTHLTASIIALAQMGVTSAFIDFGA